MSLIGKIYIVLLPIVKINKLGYLCIVQKNDLCYVTKDETIWRNINPLKI